MAIKVTGQGKEFYIKTLNTMYQMKVDEFGVLKHIWYGADTDCDMEYLLDYPDVGFSGNIYDAENRRNYSLDTLPLEYSGAGVGDFRCPAAEVIHSNGSEALDLRFESYRVKKENTPLRACPRFMLMKMRLKHSKFASRTQAQR